MEDGRVSNEVLLRIEEFGGSTVVSDLRIAVSTRPCHEGSAVTPPDALIAVDNQSSVTVYNKNRSGNLPPVRVIRGPHTQLEATTNVATDGQGRLYVLDSGNLFTAHETAKVLVFDAGANGDAGPIRVITSPASIPEANCLAVDDSGQVFVGEVGLFGEGSFAGSVAVFAPGADGNSTPTQIITDGANAPFAIAVNRSGSKLYVANGEYGAPISIYEKNAAGMFLRTRTVSASDHNVVSTSLAVDTVGTVYVLTDEWPDREIKVLVFEPDTNRSLVESRQMTIATGPNRRLTGTEELVIGVDRLYVFVGGYARSRGQPESSYHVKVYNKFARGVTSPVRVIQGPRTELSYPSGIAFIP